MPFDMRPMPALTGPLVLRVLRTGGGSKGFNLSTQSNVN